MSFKINRIKSEKESYRTTVGWLNDFSKSANFQDRIKERRDRPVVEKFSTIEDKMEDMKARVGFSNLKNINASDSSATISKIAGKTCNTCEVSGCECKTVETESGEQCKICVKKNKINSDHKLKEIAKRIESLLVYVEDLIKDRGYSTKAEVYGHCKSDPELYFENVSKNIDHQKFENYLGGLFDKYSKPQFGSAKYIPRDEMADDISFDDMTPSYFKTHDY